jgi:hypothetical protein
MNKKQRFLNINAPVKSVFIGGLAAAASAIATMVVPTAPAEAQNSPVSPAPVQPDAPINPDLGGTTTDTGTTTGGGTTTDGGTTGGGTTTDGGTTGGGTTTDGGTTGGGTTTDGGTTGGGTTTDGGTTGGGTTAPQNFGVLGADFVNAQALALGISPAEYFGLPVVQAAIGNFGNGAQGFLSAFAAKLQQGGLFNVQAYQNQTFVNLIANATNVGEAISGFNALSAERLALLYRLGFTRFANLPIRRARVFSRIRYFDITLGQVAMYKFTSQRFVGAGGRIVPGLFNRERSRD